MIGSTAHQGGADRDILRSMVDRREVENRDSLDNHPAPASEAKPADVTQSPSGQEFRAALARILNSEVFRSSESLRRLLSYLGEKSLDNTVSHLKEYTIGVEAFNKPPDYDPQVDTTVRVVASKLRHRLEEYYFREGAQDPVRIDLPRGHFALRFATAPQQTPALKAGPPSSLLWKWRALTFFFAGAACISLAAAVYSRVGFGNRAPAETGVRPLTPELQLIWDPLLKGDRPVVISLGTPRFTKFKSGFFRNPRVNTDEEAEQSEDLKAIQKLVQSPFAVSSYAYTGAGEAVGAFRLGRFLHNRAANLTLRRSNSLHWDDIRTGNVIFIGAPKFNLQLYDIPVGDGFIIHNGAIRNPKPRPGELIAYRSTWASNETDLLEDYGLISRLRSLHGTGEIMALGAGSTEATWAAVEYVTQPEYARDLVKRVGKSSGTLPDCYQVLVRVRFKQQVPVEISYVTHRILPPPWLSPFAAASGPPQ